MLSVVPLVLALVLGAQYPSALAAAIPVGKAFDQPVITPDWRPTILAMTGSWGDEGHNRTLDGISLVPVLHEISGELPGKAAELRGRIGAWRAEIGAQSPRPTPSTGHHLRRRNRG